MDSLFDPPNERWTPVSPKLATARRIVAIASCVVFGAAFVVASVFWPGWLWLTLLVAAVAVGTAVWCWFWASRNQRSWGYAENAEDLWIKHGVAWRQIVAVPYGRVQYVDVTAGPLSRALGIAQVSLHTASSQTTATIPGLLADDATHLRDRLTELRKTHGSGI